MELKTRLSNYVHTYTRTNEELHFNSDYLKTASKLINETINFIEYSLNRKGNSYLLQNICISTLNDQDKKILTDWKSGKIRDEDALKEILKKQKVAIHPK